MELKLFYSVVVFIYGTLFGSFYNVVGWRVPQGLSIVKPGSFCPKCKHKLKWYELIPVFSYVIQGGKCRVCKEKISWFYTFTELLTGILFTVAYLLFGFSFEFFLSTIVISYLGIVIVSDTNFMIIPDSVTLIASLLVYIIRIIYFGFMDASMFLLWGIGAFLLMYLFMLLGNFLFKKESLGGGDIKLMFFIGLALGPWMSIFNIFLSSFIALPLSLIIYTKSKNGIIPYGPFLLISCLIIVLFQIDINMILGI